MKVLFLVNYAGKAGIEKYVENLVRLLPEQGVACHFAYNVPGELSEKLAAAGVPCLRLSLEWKDALSAAGILARYCREQGIEVIHAQCPRENIIALLARRRLKTLRVVYTEHFNRRVGILWRALYRHFTPENHRLIAVCRASAASMEANGCKKEKIQVVYNGIDPAQAPAPTDRLRRELKLPEGTALLVCLSRLSPEKGVDFLVRALAELNSRTSRPFCCAVAGDGPMEAEVRTLAEKLGLADRLRLLGYRTDTADILASADLYVCPSATEALSFALLEAMNAGLPMAVTAVGGNVELVEEPPQCGVAVPYGDAAAFGSALAALLEDEGALLRYGQAAREKIRKQFDLRLLAAEVCQTYRA